MLITISKRQLMTNKMQGKLPHTQRYGNCEVNSYLNPSTIISKSSKEQGTRHTDMEELVSLQRPQSSEDIKESSSPFLLIAISKPSQDLKDHRVRDTQRVFPWKQSCVVR
jgi:hypothetical protein